MSDCMNDAYHGTAFERQLKNDTVRQKKKTKYLGYTVYDKRKKKAFNGNDRLVDIPQEWWSLPQIRKHLDEYKARWPKRAKDFCIVGWRQERDFINVEN